MAKYLWIAIATVIGGSVGYAYYHFIGCQSGTCPITSNPWISTSYGALLGFVLVLGRTNRKNHEKSEQK
ncbi:MAG: DUF6132 family protein [candidate division KSB1 bacterium]|nr:DUF6132 family protein [candidate division KSB1 bacterium]MDZ7319066.1 DUF6132 family protein [candidate division KSB1 bacterium]MDZ7340537.1 DUF6132 family protein [candidate division KSB1 bacterium]